MSSLITFDRPDGRRVVLADVLTDRSAEAKCAECRVSIQRTADGELVDGVRAHYRTVHPERNVR